MELSDAREVNKYLTEYIKFADAKAGIVLTFTSLVGGAFGAAAPVILSSAQTLNYWVFVFGVFLCATVVASVVIVLYNAISAILPCTPKAEAPAISFPDIAAMEQVSYIQTVQDTTSAELLRQYGSHNWVLARIVDQKFKSIGRAIPWALVALCAGFLAIMIYAVAKVPLAKGA